MHDRFSFIMKTAYAVPMKKYCPEIIIQPVPDVQHSHRYALKQVPLHRGGTEEIERARDSENEGRCLVRTYQNVFRSPHKALLQEGSGRLRESSAVISLPLPVRGFLFYFEGEGRICFPKRCYLRPQLYDYWS
jgi:hypothetical protein